MAKFNVDTIKKEANATYRHYRGRKGNELSDKHFQVWQIRFYARKILFLCKQIEKLEKAK